MERLDSGKREILCQDGASWRWTMGHAADVAYAVVLAAESEETGFSVYNVGEACTPAMRERADLIAEIMGVKIEWKETADDLPEEFSMFGRARTDFVVDTTLIRRRLGFKERLSSRDAIKDLVQWSCSSFRHATR
ncbi:MAG: NAD(P)-dependent oxidoreductase [Armatimonadetes bacterium]|nr:NAD(P)-dependent oxidoreductase [Armatimonadota bacterium]